MTIEPFRTRDFNPQLQRTLGKVYVDAASIGECLATTASIEDGNLESWHTAWRALAESLEGRAREEHAAGRRETARRLFLRATEAFRQAGFFHRVDLDCMELQPAWRKSEDCLQEAMGLTDHVYSTVKIPFEDRALYASLVMPAAVGGPWPTLILPSGYDSSVEEVMLMNGLSALARGYTVLAVDGPGHPRFRDGPAGYP